uniref:CDP-diacylglycerol--glycerol-3-phosphate 3-phosphatidyltransferase n=1 Tax=Desulfobacca acetoxidans TaxID=60893 RepID=A0A7V4G7V0_9BACT
MSEPDSAHHLTIPNLITLIRILLTPLFIIFLIQKRYPQAFAVFLAAGISDLLDGLVARMWRQRSPLGIILDPLADKLLMSASFVTLGIMRLIPGWLTVVVLSRDLILMVGVLVFRLVDYPLVIRPSLAGKLTTTLQITVVLLVLMGKTWSMPGPVLPLIFWAAGGLTVISGLHYILRALAQVAQAEAAPEKDDG